MELRGQADFYGAASKTVTTPHHMSDSLESKILDDINANNTLPALAELSNQELHSCQLHQKRTATFIRVGKHQIVMFSFEQATCDQRVFVTAPDTALLARFPIRSEPGHNLFAEYPLADLEFQAGQWPCGIADDPMFLAGDQ